MKAEIIPYTLIFKAPGGTSRGVLKTKDTWFLKLSSDDKVGWGEIGLFKGLSSDDKPEFEEKLNQLKDSIESNDNLGTLLHKFREWPAIRFGIEQAFASYSSTDPFILVASDFVSKSKPIVINGLVWMGDFNFMKSQIEEKIQQGFRCIKLKIGAINFEREIVLIETIRKSFSKNEIEIRVDANGAFSYEESIFKLERLASLDIHSIEQPIKQGQVDRMKKLCKVSPIPIALDEELIGINEYSEKQKLLEHIQPDFIILKPSLLGGWSSCDEWIELAEQLEIGWWVTSALESNIGLNAIAQYVASKNDDMPQGLGTGALFTNNVPSPLKIDNGALIYDSNLNWDIALLSNG